MNAWVPNCCQIYKRLMHLNEPKGTRRSLIIPYFNGNLYGVSKNLSFIFIKMFLQPIIKRFQNFYFYLNIHFYIFLFLRSGENFINGVLSNVFLIPMNQKVLIPMNQKVLCKRGAKPPTCRDVCYHRYPEMSGALSYWLRAEGPQWTKCFDKSLFFVF